MGGRGNARSRQMRMSVPVQSLSVVPASGMRCGSEWPVAPAAWQPLALAAWARNLDGVGLDGGGLDGSSKRAANGSALLRCAKRSWERLAPPSKRMAAPGSAEQGASAGHDRSGNTAASRREVAAGTGTGTGSGSGTGTAARARGRRRQQQQQRQQQRQRQRPQPATSTRTQATSLTALGGGWRRRWRVALGEWTRTTTTSSTTTITTTITTNPPHRRHHRHRPHRHSRWLLDARPPWSAVHRPRPPPPTARLPPPAACIHVIPVSAKRLAARHGI